MSMSVVADWTVGVNLGHGDFRLFGREITAHGLGKAKTDGSLSWRFPWGMPGCAPPMCPSWVKASLGLR